jgi:HSP20 family protein
MALVRYDPWNMLDQFRREMDRMYETRGGEEREIATSDWVPAVDVREDADCFVITADIPGVDPKDVEVNSEGGQLTIKGQRDLEKKEQHEGYKRVERAYGSFFRRFTLPDTADVEKITAKTNHGVLEVRIPKHEKLQPRKITVEG